MNRISPRVRRFFSRLGLVAAVAITPLQNPAAAATPPRQIDAPTLSAARFEENRGQAASDVRYIVRRNGEERTASVERVFP